MKRELLRFGCAAVPICLVLATMFLSNAVAQIDPGYCTGLCYEPYVYTSVTSTCGSPVHSDPDDETSPLICENENNEPRTCSVIDGLEQGSCAGELYQEPSGVECFESDVPTPLAVNSYYMVYSKWPDEGCDCTYKVQHYAIVLADTCYEDSTNCQ